MKKIQFSPQTLLNFAPLIFFIIATIIFLVTPLQIRPTEYLWSNDFMSYNLGARLFWQHQNLYELPRLLALRDHLHLNFLAGQGFVYPPFLAFYLFPFTKMSIATSITIWYFLNITLYSLTGFWILKRIKDSSFKRKALTMLMFFTFPPMLGGMTVGQINLQILFWFVIIWWLWEKKHFVWSGIVLAMTAHLKVFPVIFTLLRLLKKKFKILLGVIIGGITFLVVPLFFNSPSIIFYYIKNVLFALQSDPDPYWTNQAVNGFFSRLFHDSDYSLPLLPAAGFNYVRLVTSIVFVATIIFLGIVTYKLRDQKEKTFELEVLSLSCIILTTGKSNFWTFAITVISFVLMIYNWEILRKSEKWLLCLAIFFYYLLTALSTYGWSLKWTPIGHLMSLLISSGFIGSAIQCFLMAKLVLDKKRTLKPLFKLS